MKKMAVLALFALLVLGLSNARAENCITLSVSCSRGVLTQSEDRLEAGDTGEAGWTGIVCGSIEDKQTQIEFLNTVFCS